MSHCLWNKLKFELSPSLETPFPTFCMSVNYLEILVWKRTLDIVPCSYGFLGLEFYGRTQSPLSLDNEEDEAGNKLLWQLDGVRHYAMDWWCWSGATSMGDWTWMGQLSNEQEEDLTIVLRNPRQHDEEAAFGAEHNSALILKEITLGTVRAQATEVVLKHIKGSDDDGEDETQTFQKGTGKVASSLDFIPDLHALTVVVDPVNDDENSAEDVSYLEKVRKQTRIHRLAFDMRNMGYRRRNLLREMRNDGLRVLDDWFLPHS
ncbi:uncharacterized protein PAC_11155 [Phialocephala subalpina]|uniref:Uncharacterized protein n=1 Tax=Phialocephala subalpina TaxID=576137 RepID=A0A1L7X8A2_9HELO|nr:uncharacterized protein PAC_11155 [Phialocephala subalpina]